MKESEKKEGGGGGNDQYDDDFDDDFNDYKQEEPKKQAGKTTADAEAPVKTGDDHYQVIGTAWSCNGATLAAAFGKVDHVSWCEH